MKIALIGKGAIAEYVLARQDFQSYVVSAILVRPEKVRDLQGSPFQITSDVDALPDDLNLVVDCAGHSALRSRAPVILRRGIDVLTGSIGALADDGLRDELSECAKAGASRLHLTSGAIGGLDCLRAAATGTLKHVTYTGRKPPKGWIGSPAEQVLDLHAMQTTAQTHFTGSARQAALAYPKNANVAAAVAMAGIGFDRTTVELIADPTITANNHQVSAIGDFGQFTFEIAGDTLPDNPRTSALAAMSMVYKIKELSAPIRF